MPDEPFFPKFRITSEEPDRERDIVRTAGLQWGNYAKTKGIFIQHKKDVPPVAICKFATGDLAVEVGKGYADGYAHFHGETEESREVEKLVKAGILSGASIGILPKSARKLPTGGKEILKAEVVEWSICSVPVCAACTRQKAMAAGCRNELILKSIPGECRCGGKTVDLDRAYLFPEKDYAMCVTAPVAPAGLQLAKVFIPKADTPTLSKAIEKAENLGYPLDGVNAGLDDGGYSLRWLGMGELEPGTMQKSELEHGITVTYGKKVDPTVKQSLTVEPPKATVADIAVPLALKSLSYVPKDDSFTVTVSVGDPFVVKSADVESLASMPVSKAMMHPAHRQRMQECYKAMGETRDFLNEHHRSGNLSATEKGACRAHRDSMDKCMGIMKEMGEGRDDEMPVEPVNKAALSPEQKKEVAGLRDQVAALTGTVRKAMGLPAA